MRSATGLYILERPIITKSAPFFCKIPFLPQKICETPTPRCIEIRPHLRPPEADKTGRRPDTTLNESSIDRLHWLSTRHDRNHATTSRWCRGHVRGLKENGVLVTTNGCREKTTRVDSVQIKRNTTPRNHGCADDDECLVTQLGKEFSAHPPGEHHWGVTVSLEGVEAFSSCALCGHNAGWMDSKRASCLSKTSTNIVRISWKARVHPTCVVSTKSTA